MEHSKKRILIIEDDDEMRSLLKDFIEEEGYEADSVEKGTYAFRKLMTDSFDLIITDIRMPGYSGLEILPELKRLQPGIPIIVITAFGSEEVYRKALLRGAYAYLEKPIHFYKLKELIQKTISLKEKMVRG
jgi:DNA-binding NtrC family response regulator